MTDARAIAAQLVDIRNVGTHKVVKLTIHAPEEHAMQIMELFGWPTGVNPVPVALARLVERKEGDATAQHDTPQLDTQPPVVTQLRPGADKRKFEELLPAQQAGILCNEVAFWTFLQQEHSAVWRRCASDVRGADDAAAVVRELCGVDSRSDLNRGNAKWSALVLAYRLWMRAPAHGAA